MIKRVKLENFACHEKTELKLPEGLIIFLGRNGAGKSSVIDAITYALYGEHSRGNNTNIVRDGAEGGKVELEFSLGGVDYRVLRQFNSKGVLEHAYLKSNSRILATGERKREGDDVAQQIRRLLGINYNQMLSAVVIQQGELDRILSEEPRNIKNLFDEIIGLTKMEEAYRNMPDVLEDFKKRIFERAGWDLNDLQKVEEELQSKRRKLTDSLEQREQLVKEVTELKIKLGEKKDKYGKLKEVKEWHSEAWKQLEILKSKLNQIYEITEENLNTFEEYFPLLGYKNIVDSRLKEIADLENERSRKELELRKNEGELRGINTSLQKLKVPRRPLKNVLPLKTLRTQAVQKAEKLKNDSVELGKSLALKQQTIKTLKKKVSKDIEDIVAVVLESYYAGSAQEVVSVIEKRERLLLEQKKKIKQIEGLRAALKEIDKKIENLSYINKKHVAELSEEIRDAEKVIGRLGGMEKKPKLQEDLSILQKILNILKRAEELQELPKIKDLKGLEVILGEDKTLHQLKNILEKPVKPFKVGELESLEQSLNELNKLLGEREALLKSAETNIKQLQEEIEKLENARRELARASEFYDLLLKIREKIYHRDGPVIKSIRTWVLTNVSSRAANYLSLFDVRVSDIRLEEKGRGISFECSYGGRKVDSKRLSGGEKVALALAIRLAISDVLGAKKFGFFILDEPTVHLDSENKKKLQEVFASLGRALRQTIIITHDEEVFEDADAMIIKFDRGTAPNAPSEVSVFRAFP
jgi:exonuclease SbcC